MSLYVDTFVKNAGSRLLSVLLSSSTFATRWNAILPGRHQLEFIIYLYIFFVVPFYLYLRVPIYIIWWPIAYKKRRPAEFNRQWPAANAILVFTFCLSALFFLSCWGPAAGSIHPFLIDSVSSMQAYLCIRVHLFLKLVYQIFVFRKKF